MLSAKEWKMAVWKLSNYYIVIKKNEQLKTLTILFTGIHFHANENSKIFWIFLRSDKSNTQDFATQMYNQTRST